jgi:hypothetical protein
MARQFAHRRRRREDERRMLDVAGDAPRHVERDGRGAETDGDPDCRIGEPHDRLLPRIVRAQGVSYDWPMLPWSFPQCAGARGRSAHLGGK